MDKLSDEYAEPCTCRNMDMLIGGHIEPFIRTVVDMQSSVCEERVTCRMMHVQRRAYAEWWTCRLVHIQRRAYAEPWTCRIVERRVPDMQSGASAEA